MHDNEFISDIKSLLARTEILSSRIDALQTKGVIRHVRTIEGVRRFKRPIGAVIVARNSGDTVGNQLVNLWSTGKRSSDGYEIYQGADDSSLTPPGSKAKPAIYYVGKEPGGKWGVYDENETPIGSYGSELDALVELDKYIEKRAPARKSRGKLRVEKIKGGTDRGNRTPPPGMHRATAEDLLEYSEIGIDKDGKEFVKAGAARQNLVDIFIWDDLTGKATAGWGYDRRDNQSQNVFFLKKGQQKNREEKFRITDRMTSKMPSFDKKIVAAAKKAGKEGDVARALVIMRRVGLRVDSEGSGQSFGATSLQSKHVQVVKRNGKEFVHFKFRAKNGDLDFEITNPDVVSVIKYAKRGKRGDDQLFPEANSSATAKVLNEHFGELGNRPNHRLRTYLAMEWAQQRVMAVLRQRQNKKFASEKEFNEAIDEIIDDIANKVLFDKRGEVLTYVNPAVFTPLAGNLAWVSEMIEEFSKSLGKD